MGNKDTALWIDFKGQEHWVIGWDVINGVYFLDADEIGEHKELVPVELDNVLEALKKPKEGKKYYAIVDGILLAKIGKEYGITGGLF